MGRAALCAHKLWWTADRKAKNYIFSFLFRLSFVSHFYSSTESQFKGEMGNMKNGLWIQMFIAKLLKKN